MKSTVNPISRVTLRDIAERQGVSHTTVSFVLRGRDMGISPEKRKGILSDAIRTKYVTRSDQRINSQKRKLLLLAPVYKQIYGSAAYVSRLTAYLSSLEEQIGLEIVVQASPDRDIMRSLYKGICEDQVDVIIPVSMGLDELRSVVALSPVPVICLDLWADVDCSIIGFDNVWIGQKAAQQFFHAGHRRAVAFTSAMYRDVSVSSFVDEFTKLGGQAQKIQFDRRADLSVICRMLKGLFTKGFDFTAVFCDDDSVAMGVMQVMHGYGLKVPDDISLIGCGDHLESKYSHPALSTFRMDEEHHGQQLINEIYRLCNDGSVPKIVANKAEFICRQSVRQI